MTNTTSVSENIASAIAGAPIIPESEFRMLPIDQVRESPLNPRKHFDPTRLAELSDSVKVHGVITPITVRAVPAADDDGSDGSYGEYFEIAAGHRRYRAASAAGLTEIPAIIRQMTDQQFAEVLSIENVQREDVHPLEEADGYHHLIEAYGYTPELLAERVHRTESYIRQRLVFVNLIEKLRQHFFDGKIQIGHAVLLARLQPSDQELALKDQAIFERRRDWVKGAWTEWTETATIRELDNWIRSNVYMDLSTTAWPKTDADLVPEAGACNVCSKRTGANAFLFDDIQKGDLCLDRECFAKKREAYLTQIQTQAASEGKPLTKISFEYNHNRAKGDDTLYEGSYRIIDPPKRVKGKKAEKDPEPACPHVERAIVVKGRDLGKVIDICKDTTCPVHGERIHSLGNRKKTFEELWSERERNLKLKIDWAVRQETWRRLCAAPQKITRVELDVIGRSLIGHADPNERTNLIETIGIVDRVEHHYGGTDAEATLEKYMEGLPDKEMPGFVVALACGRGLRSFGATEDMFTAAANYGIDKKVVDAEIGDPMRQAFKEKKAASKLKKAAEAKAEAAKARTYNVGDPVLFKGQEATIHELGSASDDPKRKDQYEVNVGGELKWARKTQLEPRVEKQPKSKSKPTKAVKDHPAGETSEADPLSVACPTCKAKPGKKCKRPSGHATFGGVPHASRVKAVQ